jgi:hypothetical protein
MEVSVYLYQGDNLLQIYNEGRIDSVHVIYLPARQHYQFLQPVEDTSPTPSGGSLSSEGSDSDDGFGGQDDNEGNSDDGNDSHHGYGNDGYGLSQGEGGGSHIGSSYVRPAKVQPLQGAWTFDKWFRFAFSFTSAKF